MASAYGGVAKPRIRKTVPRFATVARIDRTGLQTSAGASRPSNPRMQNLTGASAVKEGEVSTAHQKRGSTKPGYTATDMAGTTRGEMTTQRTGNTHLDSKNGFK